MTQHRSLKTGGEETKFRSVLKRHERVKEMAGKEKWNEEKDSVYHLPKLKRIKFKTKKVKGPAEEEGAAPAAGGAPAAGAPGAAGTAGAGGAGSAPAKGAAGKAGKEGKK